MARTDPEHRGPWNAAAVTVLGCPMTTTKPIAVFASEEDLLDAVASAKASLAMSGVELSADGEAMLVQAIRDGISLDEYARWVEDAVFWARSA